MQQQPTCTPLSLANWAAAGWLEARATAARGGAPELVGPARAAIQRLTEVSGRSLAWRRHGEYAQAAIMAAIAASQDERPEMSLYLVHARALAERLTLTGEDAEWPLPINELEGELWLEVDRYAEARVAYQRAIDAFPYPAALVGLARASHELGDAQAACDTFRRASATAAGPLAEEARAYLSSETCNRSEPHPGRGSCDPPCRDP